MKTVVPVLLTAFGLVLLPAVLAADKVKISLHEGSVYNLTGPDSMPESDRSLVWIASAPERTRILIRVVDFMLRSVNDTLTIGTGSDFRDSSTTLTSLVGRFPRHSVLLPSDMGWLHIDSAAISSPENRMRLELTALQPHQEIAMTGNSPIEISSPGYPLEYPNYADFSWTIKVPAGNSSLVRFIDVDVEYYYDKILIGTGVEVEDASWLTRISRSFNGTVLPTDVVLAERYIWIRFKSDRSKTYGGFQLSVIPRPSLDNFDFYEESSGQPIKLDIGDEINLVSPNYPSPYPHGENTTWYFDPPTGHLLRVDVISCHLEPRHDSVRIGTGRQVDGNSSLRLTGTSTPRGYSQLFAVNESLWIQFLSDFSVSYQGFWLRISAEREIVQDNSDRPSGISDSGAVDPAEVGHDKGKVPLGLSDNGDVNTG
ncbi:procollagen C-endopeptidase enhancer 1-like [Diadema setosum]|uniref:procollagen C-endopeptidase enhancer 1-like n=1 Tax=Diadema setosum TaxID=31175 RepID=UPI003B3AB2E1